MKKKKKLKNRKSTFSEVKIGCAISGLDCSGICSKLHSEICISKFKYKWEFNKKYKEGKQMIILKSPREEQLLKEAMGKG